MLGFLVGVEPEAGLDTEEEGLDTVPAEREVEPVERDTEPEEEVDELRVAVPEDLEDVVFEEDD